MLHAKTVLARNSWSGEAVDTVILDSSDRLRQRATLKGVRGVEIALDLPQAMMLRGGDALLLESDDLVEIVAAPESLAELRCATPDDMVRLAWRLGERGAAIQIVGQKLRIRRDPAAQDMARSLGAKVMEIEAPFDPEGAVYAVTQGHEHGHAHVHGHAHGACGCGHDHAHDHKHGHDHGHQHAHGHHHDHAQDSCCGHDHGHDHSHGSCCGHDDGHHGHKHD